MLFFFTWVETRTRSTTQKTVGGPPRPPEPMSLLHQGEDNIRDKDVDNNVEDEAVNYKHNRCGWSSMPHRTMSLYEEVNNCVEDLSGGADDEDNHEHANDN